MSLGNKSIWTNNERKGNRESVLYVKRGLLELKRLVRGLPSEKAEESLSLLRRRSHQHWNLVLMGHFHLQQHIIEYHIFLSMRVCIPTVVGGCIQGSPSICIGKVFLVFITTDEHWASLRPLALSPVRTWPICKQFSKPIISIRPSPMSEITLITIFVVWDASTILDMSNARCNFHVLRQYICAQQPPPHYVRARS